MNQEKPVQLRLEKELQERQNELDLKEKDLKLKIETEQQNYEKGIKEQNFSY